MTSDQSVAPPAAVPPPGGFDTPPSPSPAQPLSAAPLVSFCVPTFNRGRYLDSLLHLLAAQLAAFPYPYEVFVSDNASTDDTPDVLAAHADRLPLRCVRHAANRGGPANWQHVMAQARGTYLIYLADDDAILGDRVADTVAKMEADPGIAIAYAPWLLYDLVADRPQGQFYRQDADLQVPQGRHAELLDALLRHSVFPEISVCRRDVLQQVMPRIHEQAFYAFVHAADFLQRGAVLLLKEPFYVSITRYFDDEQRTQQGTEEAEVAWDRYRGGLEYILGRAGDAVTPAQRADFAGRIARLIAQRISVAVRLRVLKRRDPVETYYLAYRLKAMGATGLLPVPLLMLRGQAAIGFLTSDPELTREVSRLVCIGEFDAELRGWVEQRAAVPVDFVADGAALPRAAQADADAESALVFARHGVAVPAWAGHRVVHEQALMARFPA